MLRIATACVLALLAAPSHEGTTRAPFPICGAVRKYPGGLVLLLVPDELRAVRVKLALPRFGGHLGYAASTSLRLTNSASFGGR
jgi:hypothetical protein